MPMACGGQSYDSISGYTRRKIQAITHALSHHVIPFATLWCHKHVLTRCRAGADAMFLDFPDCEPKVLLLFTSGLASGTSSKTICSFSCPVTQCSPGWPRYHRGPPAPASRILGLKAWPPSPGLDTSVTAPKNGLWWGESNIYFIRLLEGFRPSAQVLCKYFINGYCLLRRVFAQWLQQHPLS